MNNQINIQKENLLNAYKECNSEQKALLINLFGEEVFKPKDIKERIKTFEDAVAELGDAHAFVAAYKIAEQSKETYGEDVIAFLKLRIIAEALNEGWRPKFDSEECRYYPWFYIYTKEEYDNLDEEEKKKCRVVGRSSYNSVASGGLVYASTNYASTCSYTFHGSRLAFKTRELAEYCGKQFIDIWEGFLFA